VATFKITLVKGTPWRGELLEEWSNSYHLAGTKPGNAAEWSALAQAIWAFEGKFVNIQPIRTHFIHGYGYHEGSVVNEWSGDFTAGGQNPGIVPAGGGYFNADFQPSPLQVAALFRWQVGLSPRTGKPRYLFKYIHDVPSHDAGPDTPGGARAEGIAAILSLTDGTLPGGVVMCSPSGVIASPGHLATWYTTHQIKRRGKRPRRGVHA